MERDGKIVRCEEEEDDFHFFFLCLKIAPFIQKVGDLVKVKQEQCGLKKYLPIGDSIDCSNDC